MQCEKAELTEVSEHFEHKQQRRSYPLKSMKKKTLLLGGKQGLSYRLSFTLLYQTYLRVLCKRIIMFRIIMLAMLNISFCVSDCKCIVFLLVRQQIIKKITEKFTNSKMAIPLKQYLHLCLIPH